MNAREAAIRARLLLTERNEALGITLPKIQALVSTTLESYIRMAFTDRSKRELLKTKFTDVVFTGGSCDLEPLTDGTNGRINLKELRETPVYNQAEATVYTWVNCYNQLVNGRPVGGDAPALFLEGSILKARLADGDLASDEKIVFTVTNYPAVVDDLPLTLEHDFVMYLSMVAARELVAGEQIAAASNK